MEHIHIMVSHKSNEVLTDDTTWMTFENIILSERRQTQKATYFIIPFTGNVQSGKTHVHRN